MTSNVAEKLTAAAQREPHRIALSEAATGYSVTWAQLDALVDRVAVGLGAAGLVAGQRVLVRTGNRIEFVAAYLGTLRAGLVAVPVNPRSTTGELIRVIADSGARLLFADPLTIDSTRAAVDGLVEAVAAGAVSASSEDLAHLRVVPIGSPVRTDGRSPETSWDDLVAAEGRVAPIRPDAEALAVLLYTSGTSGVPRAAMLSHRALLANIDQVAQIEPPMIHGNDVVLGVLPMFHVYGLNAVLGQVLEHQARLVLVDGFDPVGTLDLIQDEAITVLPVAPPVFAYWRQVDNLKDNLGPVRLALSGSAPLSEELSKWFTAATGIAIHQGYGLTEASPVVTSTLCSKTLQTGSVGAALPGVEIRLADDRGTAPEGDDAGEILIRGANLFSGYWPDGAEGPDAEGWYATGDVGFLDPSGDLFLVDRLRELVIVSGFNVYPSEVEDVLREIPAVAGAAVIGVPDELTGEAVVAYLKPADGSSEADVRELALEAAERRLARFKRPKVIHIVDELPLTVTGKVQKGRLRAAERSRALGLLEE